MTLRPNILRSSRREETPYKFPFQRFNDLTIQRRSAALSLIEIMVSVTLLSLIVIGLLAVFNHTQRALRMANSQTDVFEGARAVTDMLQRDLTELNASGDTNVNNIYVSDVSTNTLPRPVGGFSTNIIQDLFLISRQNDNWSAFGYFLDNKAAGVGTLYRYETNGWWFGNGGTNNGTYFTNWWIAFGNSTVSNAHRIVDGVVHFQARAFDERGRVYAPTWFQSVSTNRTLDTSYVDELRDNIGAGGNGFAFRGRFLPAFVEVEIGILEPQTARQFYAMADVNPPAAQAFLQNQLGKIHMFRQRIPVRNHTKPEAFE